MSSSVLLPASEAISKNSVGLPPDLRFAEHPRFSLSFLCTEKKRHCPGNSLFPVAAVLPFLI